MRALDTLCVGFAMVAGLILFFLVGLTFLDVIMRYIFSSPIFGARDVLEMGMIVVISLGFPFTWRVGGHIVVDLLPDYGFAFLTAGRDIFVRIIGIIIFGFLAWRSWHTAEDAALFNEKTNMIELPFQPFLWLLAFASVFQAAVLLTESIRILLKQNIEHSIRLHQIQGESAVQHD